MKKVVTQFLIVITLLGCTFGIPTSAGKVFAAQYTDAQCAAAFGAHSVSDGASGCKCADGYQNGTTGQCVPTQQAQQQGQQTPTGVATGGPNGVDTHQDNGGGFLSGLLDILLKVPGALAAKVVLPIVGWITTLSGVLLNSTIYYTVVEMAQNYAKIGAIDSTWGVVRDVANMFFIFALLYAALMTMFGQGNYKQVIKNTVIAAVLINFSLFFTKVVIDAGNLAALTIYKAMVPNTAFTDTFNAGIANAFMDQLKLATIWKNIGDINGTRLYIIGVVGSIVALISAFVFFAIAIMFVIRYIVLIFVLILSPLMAVSLILPGVKKAAGQWKDALIGQTFFAPIYFFLTWITLKLTKSMWGADTDWSGALSATYQSGKFAASPDSFSVLLDFAVLIGFMILSLSVAKSYASKGGGLVSSATKWATGFAGGATLGMAGRFGRGTVGRYANSVANDKDLIEKASRGDMGARLKLAAAERIAKSSFDVRGTPLGGTLGGGKARQGGFAADLKNKNKRQEELAKKLGPTDEEKAEHKVNVEAAEARQNDAKAALEKARTQAIRDTETAVLRSPELVAAEKAEDEAKTQIARTAQLGFKPNTEEAATLEAARKEADRLRAEHEKKKKEYVDSSTAAARATHDAAEKKTSEIRNGGPDSRAKRAAEHIENKNKKWRPTTDRVLGFFKVKTEEIEKAKILRRAAKSQSTAEKLAELARERQKEVDAETGNTEANKTPESGGEEKPAEQGNEQKPS